MAISEQAALLDELMGKNRNSLPDESGNHGAHWSDEDVCKYYICGFCPSELFTNTKADLGPCPNEHDERMQEVYKKSPRAGKMGYEKDFVRYLNSLLVDVERRIRRGHARLNLNSTMSNPNGLGNTERKTKLESLTDKINELVAESEKLGTEGCVEKAQAVLKQCEQLKQERSQIEEDFEERPGGLAKELEVCEICGAFRIRDDAPQRIEEHLIGKMHLGYARIRDYIREFEEKENKRRDDRSRDHDKDRDARKPETTRTPRDKSKSRDRDRDRVSSRRSRSKSRNESTRRRDRRSRSNSRQRHQQRPSSRDRRDRDMDQDKSNSKPDRNRDSVRSRRHSRSRSRDKRGGRPSKDREQRNGGDGNNRRNSQRSEERSSRRRSEERNGSDDHKRSRRSEERGNDRKKNRRTEELGDAAGKKTRREDYREDRRKGRKSEERKKSDDRNANGDQKRINRSRVEDHHEKKRRSEDREEAGEKKKSRRADENKPEIKEECSAEQMKKDTDQGEEISASKNTIGGQQGGFSSDLGDGEKNRMIEASCEKELAKQQVNLENIPVDSEANDGDIVEQSKVNDCEIPEESEVKDSN